MIWTHGRLVLTYAPPSSARAVLDYQTSILGYAKVGPVQKAHAYAWAARHTIGARLGERDLPWDAWGEATRIEFLEHNLPEARLAPYLEALLFSCSYPASLLDALEEHMERMMDEACTCGVCRGEAPTTERIQRNCLNKSTPQEVWDVLGAVSPALEGITTADPYRLYQVRARYMAARNRVIATRGKGPGSKRVQKRRDQLRRHGYDV